MKWIEGIKPNPRLAVFMICLVISSVFWITTILSKEYTHTTSLAISYVQVPAGKSISKGLPDSIDVTLSGTGLHLLVFLWLTPQKNLEADMGQLRYNYRSDREEVLLNLNQQLMQFSEQLNLNSLKVIKINPGQLLCFLEQPYSRIVPIQPKVQCSFSNEYNLSGAVTFSPQKVIIRGSRSEIEKIDTLFTEVLTLQYPTNTHSYTVPLVIPEGVSQFSVPCKSAIITVPVDKFTETEITCEIQTIGIKNPYSIKLFPEKATIFYQVPLSKFKSVKPEDFTVVADASEAEKGDGKNLLKISLRHVPDFTRNCRIEPPSVEYILTKKP